MIASLMAFAAVSIVESGARAQLADVAVGHMRDRIGKVEQSWAQEAALFRTQLEFSGALEVADERLRLARLMSFATNYAGLGSFTHVYLIDPRGRTLFAFRTRSTQDLPALPADVAIGWNFGAQDRQVYRSFAQNLLLQGRPARLLIHFPLDNGLLQSMSYPGLSTVALREGQVVAAAGEAGAESRDAGELRRVAWGTDPGAPTLQMKPPAPALWRAIEVAGVVLGTTLLVGLVSWLALGRWLSRITARMTALAGAARAFGPTRTLAPTVEAGLDEARAAPDELAALAGATRTMMDNVVEAERAQAASEARFRSLAELGSDWFWEQDPEARFVWLTGNRYGSALGFEPDAATGRTLWELPLEQVDADSLAAHRRTVEARRPFQNFVFAVRNGDAALRWIALNGVPLFDADDDFIGYRGTGSDITELKAKEGELAAMNASLEARVVQRTRELVAANGELEAFAYSVSHDLRAPLRGIEGFALLLQDEHREALGPVGGGHLQRVLRGVRRMGQIIDDLLRLSRVARAPLRLTAVDLTALCREHAADIDRQRGEPRIDWRIAAGMTVDADAGLLRSAMENLLDNAAKYSRNQPQPVIEVFARDEAGGCEVAVRDNGVGFDMAHAGMLFKAFQRLHAQNDFEGTGVGLATVARIVARHGGRIRAEASPGRGACFRFFLPSKGVQHGPG